MSNRPLRILTVAEVPPDPNGGASGTVYHTNVAFRDLGHDVDEVWAEDLGKRRIRHGNLHSLLEQPRAYRRVILERVAKTDYDVVMISQPQAYLAARSLKQRGFKGVVVNRSHGLELRVNDVLPKWHRQLNVAESRFPTPISRMLQSMLQHQWAATVRWCDGIIVTCEMDRNYIAESFPDASKKVRTIYHGVPREYLERAVAPMNEERAGKILYVGQYSFIKGTSFLPQIVNQALGRIPGASFAWVTSEWAHQEIRSRLEPSVMSRVQLFDSMPQSQLVELCDRHGLFVFPSLFEGAGKASLEAMARGLCVIASDTGGMRDHISNGQNGFLCDVGDVNGFVERLVQMTGSVDRLTEISKMAVQTARQYSWERCAAEACDFYRQLLGEPSAVDSPRAVSGASRHEYV